MPLDMPESVLVRFKGDLQPGVTRRDLVHAIPLYAIKAGQLTVEKKGKKNIFSGRILEIEGLPKLKIEQAFELALEPNVCCSSELDDAKTLSVVAHKTARVLRCLANIGRRMYVPAQRFRQSDTHPVRVPIATP